MKNEYSIGIIPIKKTVQGLKFLLVQHNQGHWGFPKGHPEKGETARETAKREFEEETGITTYNIQRSPAFVESYINPKQERMKTVLYFIAYVDETDLVIQEEEIQGYGWFKVKSVRAQISFDESRNMFDDILEYLEQTQQL